MHLKLHQFRTYGSVKCVCTVFTVLAWSVHIVSVSLAKCTTFCLLFRKQWKVMKRNWLSFPGGKPKNGLYTFYVVCLKGKIVNMGLTRLGTLHKLSLFWERQRGRGYCVLFIFEHVQKCTASLKKLDSHQKRVPLL